MSEEQLIDGDMMDAPLSEDHDTPFSEPDDSVEDMAAELGDRRRTQIESTHQATDTNIDSHQLYDEGLSGAAEATEPNAGSAVEGYDPKKDHSQP